MVRTLLFWSLEFRNFLVFSLVPMRRMGTRENLVPVSKPLPME